MEHNNYPMSEKNKTAYMSMTLLLGSQSHAKRKKVGSLIVKSLSHHRWQIISDGVNGMRPGEDNKCELPDGTTHPLCRHAERNAIAKLHQEPVSTNTPLVLFVTFQPCLDCATRIDDAGISHVFYCFDYKCRQGLDYLDKCNISYSKIDFESIIHLMPEHMQTRVYFDASGSARDSGVDVDKLFAKKGNITNG
ncbi:hypothetical protein GR7B_00183 [Vibrio phage vB_VcorM_GR7B]|nr:hypothetical protein GR7B_00183 [Vibrio phage vB_VcorM_GR7B]